MLFLDGQENRTCTEICIGHCGGLDVALRLSGAAACKIPRWCSASAPPHRESGGTDVLQGIWSGDGIFSPGRLLDPYLAQLLDPGFTDHRSLSRMPKFPLWTTVKVDDDDDDGENDDDNIVTMIIELIAVRGVVVMMIMMTMVMMMRMMRMMMMMMMMMMVMLMMMMMMVVKTIMII